MIVSCHQTVSERTLGVLSEAETTVTMEKCNKLIPYRSTKRRTPVWFSSGLSCRQPSTCTRPVIPSKENEEERSGEKPQTAH